MNRNPKPYRCRNIIAKKNNVPPGFDSKENANSQKGETGYLEISVYNNVETNPVENAMIHVYLLTITGQYQEKGEGQLMATVETGINGHSPIIELPTLNKLQHPNEPNYIKMYMFSVQAEGYFGAFVFDIQIYPNITTSYQINLRHIERDESPLSHYEFFYEPTDNIPF